MSGTRGVGDRIPVQYRATDPFTQEPVAVTAVLTVTDPSGTTSTPSITTPSTGVYNSSFTLSAAGIWLWQWDISGALVDRADGQVLATDPEPPTYISVGALKGTLQVQPTDPTRDDLLQLAVTGASRSVEQYCDGRVFYRATTATARIFSTARRTICRDGSYRLLVDDIATTAGLIVEVGDGTTWTTVTVTITWPENALARGRAIEALISTDDWRQYAYVRVTAVWGWPAVPTAVEQATLLQATRLYRRKDSPEGVAGSAEWGLVRVPNLDPDVKALLAYLVPPMRVA